MSFTAVIVLASESAPADRDAVGNVAAEAANLLKGLTPGGGHPVQVVGFRVYDADGNEVEGDGGNSRIQGRQAAAVETARLQQENVARLKVENDVRNAAAEERVEEQVEKVEVPDEFVDVSPDEPEAPEVPSIEEAEEGKAPEDLTVDAQVDRNQDEVPDPGNEPDTDATDAERDARENDRAAQFNVNTEAVTAEQADNEALQAAAAEDFAPDTEDDDVS